MKLTDEEKRARGLVRYEELTGKAKEEAYNRFAYNLDGSPRCKKQDILDQLSKHWFDKSGGTFLGTN